MTATLLPTPLPYVDFGSLAVDPNSYDPDTILVRLTPEYNSSTLLPAGLAIGNALPLVPGLHEVQVPAGMTVQDALGYFRGLADVVYAQPNYRVTISQIPNDPLFSQQYALRNTGQTGGTPDADIDAAEAWDTFTGNGGPIIAVIDTGVDHTHPDLAANIWTNPGEIAGNGQDDDSNGFIDDVHGYDFVSFDGDPMDDHGHGTHVAGVIGAVGNNGVGIAGIAWNVRIMAVKFLDANGSGFLSAAVQALNYAVANGAKVSNNSWGGGGFEQALYDAIQNAGAQDHIFVAAAGNSSVNNDIAFSYPASYDLPNIVSVAATDHNDALAYFSNYGRITVDLGAPGVDILSTVPVSGELGSSSRYLSLSGTSMATPHVSGVVGLVRAIHPEWGYSQVINQVLGTVDPVQALDGRTVSGGRLNAAAALTGTPPPDVRGPHVTSSTPAGVVTQPVSTLRVTFHESIDVNTFNLDDIVSFTGPSGSLSASGVAVVAGTNDRSFNITFPTQAAEGDYSLVLGPDIRDPSGNAMDQDQDGVNGESTHDRYTARFSIGDSNVYVATDVPMTFGFGQFHSYIDIPDDIIIGDLNVTVTISHPSVSDLSLILEPPSLLSYLTLVDRTASGANFTDTTFDDEATTFIWDGTAPYTGSYRPQTFLYSYDGMNARGRWTLTGMNFGLASGTLLGWSITITPGDGGPPGPGPNEPPVANDDYATTTQDTPVVVNVLANDTDPNGDPLTVVGVSLVWGGSAVINPNNTVTFTPAPGFVGQASFSYTISDGLLTATGTAFIDVQSGPSPPPINQPPVANTDYATTEEDTPVVIDVLANDTDPNGDPLIVILVSNVSGGSAIFNPDNTVTFTPAPGFIGQASLNYTISDGLLTAIGTVYIDVQPAPPPPNQPPVANPDSATTTENTPVGINVLANDFDPEGAPLFVVAVANVSGGTATINPDNTITFTPAPGFVGSASFDYTISDGDLTASSNVVIDVQAVNEPPVAQDDFFSTPLNTLLTIPAAALLANDSDPDGDSLTVIGVSNPVNGSVTLSGGLITFTPQAGYQGTGGFDYTISDGQATDTAHVYVNIQGVYYLSLAAAGTLVNSDGSSVSFTGSDILRLSVNADGTYLYEIYFDGSDVGLGASSENIDAFTFMSDGSILVSTSGSVSVPGVSGAREDLLRFQPQTTGDATSGTWSLFFDGSDVGLTTTGENVDAVSVRPDGQILVSTTGAFSVTGLSGEDEDVIIFTPTQLGNTTSGLWLMYFDGSDVGLASSADEDVDALFVSDGNLYFSTVGNFSVAGAGGANEDIFKFVPTSLGPTTAGVFGPGLTFDGSLYGLGAHNVDGIHLGSLSGSSGSAASSLSTTGSAPTAGTGKSQQSALKQAALTQVFAEWAGAQGDDASPLRRLSKRRSRWG